MGVFARPQNSRIAALATLPVFFELRGKPVLVAGGSEAAAWKAELLAAAGAHVHVFCLSEDLSEPMRALLHQFAHHDAHWQAAHFKSFRLAVGDCETSEEARLFHDRALKAGVPVNVIDKPDFCQFKFGSIVNRSPVVIGISTDGAAPILGQAIRRRIEALLPQSLKAWAELAQAVRTHVTEALTSAQRRSFWEQFVDRAFDGAKPENDTARQLMTDADRIRSGVPGQPGQVILVGAGPGDAELLTLKAVRVLQSADVILFDDLVSGEILELARREAQRVAVGERGREDISDILVRFARAGKRAVWLRSGDAMIFGRAGEELARLEADGIAVAVVPDVFSASSLDFRWTRYASISATETKGPCDRILERAE